MREFLVLTIIGEDRPGVVEAVSDAVHEAGANWEASRMARLAGRFAGILSVTVDSGGADSLTNALQGLTARGLKVVIERSESEPPRPEASDLRLELVGQDRPGITRDVARVLASRQVNVEELNSSVEAAPMGGGTLFRLTAELRSPPSVDMGELREALETIAHDLMVDLHLMGVES